MQSETSVAMAMLGSGNSCADGECPQRAFSMPPTLIDNLSQATRDTLRVAPDMVLDALACDAGFVAHIGRHGVSRQKLRQLLDHIFLHEPRRTRTPQDNRPSAPTPPGSDAASLVVAPTAPEPVRPQPLLIRARQRLRDVLFPGGEDQAVPAGGRLFACRELIAAQTAVLRAWATEADCLLDGVEFFREWDASNAEEGAEHRVVYQDGVVFKLYGGLASTRRGYAEYFDRLMMHNELFPDTGVWFEGFIEDDRRQLLPVISQHFVRAARGAVLREVVPAMKARGFSHVGESYGFTNGQVVVDDLHGENVLVREDGSLAIIDPIIRRQS